MPTDTIITTSMKLDRQDGNYASLSKTTARAAAQETVEVSVASKAEANEARQDLSLREQELPPAAAEGSEEKLQQAVSDINSYVQNLQRDLQFKVDTDLGQTVVYVVDSETQEVIRQLPREDVLERARLLQEQADGNSGPDGLLLKTKI